MLGLADRGLVIDLFEAVMAGDTAAALKLLKDLYDVGADPAVVLDDLAAFTHVVTRLKLAAAAADDQVLTEEERTRGRALADKLSLRTLARAWQMLLEGHRRGAHRLPPAAAADMVLVRLAHVADLPTPDEAVARCRRGRRGAARPLPAAPAPPATPAPA